MAGVARTVKKLETRCDWSYRHAMSTFVRRMTGAMALRAKVFEEIEADRGANLQAIAVVLLSAAAAGVGVRGAAPPTAMPTILLLAVLAWPAWAVMTYQIGTRLLPGPGTRSDVGELLRTLGFAAAPGILRVVGVVPALSGPAFAITTVWMLCAMVVAVRQALDYTSTARALAVCLIGLVLTLLMVVAIGVATTTPLYGRGV